MTAVSALLFDLDGTLVDTRSASWPLFAETSRAFDLGIDTREQFFALFDRNIFEALAHHCGDRARAAAAAKHFMDLVREHYDPPFIDGIVEVVQTLAQAHTLALVSSNMRDIIERLLDRGGVARHFVHVYGGDVQPSKAAAIADFLAGGWAPGAPCVEDPQGVVLVSDTAGDIGEALSAGIRAIGVDWGMHDAGKLAAAGAERVVSAPTELLAWIRAT